MKYNSLPRCRNHEWRVVRHRGSDGDEYKFEYNLEEGDPLVTDGQGRTDRYLWGPLYDVYKHVDALGNCWRAEIIAGRSIKRTDPQGSQWNTAMTISGV